MPSFTSSRLRADALLGDVAGAVRHVIARPAFAVTAILSLAVGLGLNVTLFSVVNAVLVRGGPMADPERLVEIYSGPRQDYPLLTTSPPDYRDLVGSVPALSEIAANAYVRAIVSSAGTPRLVTGEAVNRTTSACSAFAFRRGRALRVLPLAPGDDGGCTHDDRGPRQPPARARGLAHRPDDRAPRRVARPPAGRADRETAA